MRLLLILAVTLILSLALAVAYPDVMIKPGELSAGHRGLERACLGCHAPIRGASSASCLSCHKLDRIGRATTAGLPLPAERFAKLRFHAGLRETDCMRCHTLHASVRHRKEATFQHALLAPAVRGDCRSCHLDRKPADELHSRLNDGCGSCHNTAAWKSAVFDHRALASGTDCAACHGKDKPEDELHPRVTKSCVYCHTTKRWRPAKFDHNRYFRFDANHPADCQVCHTDGSTFSIYTCYGCHEHSPAGILAEHREEGIRNVENCARCHRSGQENEAEGGGEQREGEEEDDD
ncbi:MAG TPA: cytochrome c3 family protein [Thermoanaerobaculia bacterium]